MNNKRILATIFCVSATTGCLMAADAKSFYAGGTQADGSGRTTTYVVKEGETLFHLAEKLMGTPYAADRLAKLNHIEDPLRVPAGTKLQIPVTTKLSIIYSVERLEDGDLVQHDPEKAMHAGDRFFVRVAANMPGYLYAFNRQANGEIERVFPSGNRHVKIDQFTEYLLPGKGAFQLDRQRGDEELWILVSATKLDDLEAAVIGTEAVSGDGKGKLVEYLKRNPSAKGIRVVDPDEDEDGTVVSVSGSGESLVLVHQIPIRRS
jgi:LysM repeat protein